MPPLKLCFVGWADHVHLERWAGYFAKRGHEVSIISFSDLGRYPEGVVQYRLGLEGRGLRWVVLKLRYLLWRIQPDIVHVHWGHFADPVRRAWSGPLAVTVWGSDVYRRDQFSDEQWARLREGIRAAAAVTCDSGDIAARICSEFHVDHTRVSVVQWGVDTHLFTPAAGPPTLAQELGAIGRPVVFSARNFTPVYNLETVVSAFAEVRRRVPTAMLVMKRYGGDAGYAALIATQIERLHLPDAVTIVETIPYEQMPDLYRMSDVTISVPVSDATPMAVLEAMACGSVPVVSDLPSLREWVKDGWNGFLVEPKDVSRLAECITRLLTEPALAREFAKRNLEIVSTRASQIENMARMEVIYRKLSESGASGPTGSGRAQRVADTL